MKRSGPAALSGRSPFFSLVDPHQRLGALPKYDLFIPSGSHNPRYGWRGAPDS